MLDGFTVAREIDLTLILAVITCTATAVGFVIRTYASMRQDQIDIEAQHREDTVRLNTEIQKLELKLMHSETIHQKEITMILSRIDEGFTRLERAYISVADELKSKMDK